MTASIPNVTRGVFVTGTDTGAGKTVASTALLHCFRNSGLRAIGMKPVASGCRRTPVGWRNGDAQPAYDDVNPYPLEWPTAPQLAARAMGVRVDAGHLRDAYARLAAQTDVLVVEGVGGWAAPFDDGLDQSDVVRLLALPVVLVVGLRLGCLSHARLAARAIAADGFELIGWIGSSIDPAFAERDDYIDLLCNALPAPCLGVLPYVESPDAKAMAAMLSLPWSS
jgi:dethiobiotin synthetase